MPLLVAAACLVVVGVEIAFRLVPFVDGATLSTPEVPAVSARPPSIESRLDVPPEVEVAKLLHVEVEPHTDFTRIRLHLNQERDYWIQGDPREGEVELVISDTRLSRAFSPQSFAGTGLSLRETHNTSVGLHLLLGFDKESRVQSQFVDDGSGTQLVLDVLSSRNSKPTVSTTSVEVPSKPSASWGRIDQNKTKLPNPAVEAFTSLDRAREFVAQGRQTEAVAEYIRALSLDPKFHRAREHLVALLIESNQLNAADEHLSAGIARAPQHSEYTLLRAQLLVAMKQPQRAITMLESFPTPENRRSDALNLLAALYQQEGDHKRAEALFRSAVRLAPHEGRLWMGLGISLEGQKRNTEALAVYEQAESLADFGAGPRSWLRSRIKQLTKVE